MKRTSTGFRGGRPTIMASNGVVSSGHYLATGIGVDILRRGGNAMDSAAAVGFALTVLKPHQNGIGGEAPMLLYSARDGKAWALSGNGTAPRAATLERFAAMGLKAIPGDGFLSALVPSAVASWILLLKRFGTMRLADVLAAAIDLAARGFGMYDALRKSIAAHAETFRSQWPSSARTFLPGGDVPPLGSLWKQPDWAETFRQLLREEGRFAQREAGLDAAYEAFYRGEIARRIVEFVSAAPILDASGAAHAGLLTVEDFAAYQAKIEDPLRTTYRGLEICKCGTWTQGPVLLQTLNLLEGYDLAGMGHNSAPYIHTVVECVKLAFADREFYYGDPDFVDVPLGRLLSKDYASERRALVDPAVASMELRPGDKPAIRACEIADVDAQFADPTGGGCGDTTKLEVIDRQGNVVSATPSGGWLMSSPVVPGLGFPLGTRGQMFSLVAGHPNALAPLKRPRTTLTPSLALRDGRAVMAFGSPGGDSQDQWALQFLLNVLEFGMSLQEAVEAPTFCSEHFPSSFYPRKAEPGRLLVESRVRKAVRDELAARGHGIDSPGAWSGGNTLAAAIDPATGLRHAAASPRLDPAYAGGF